MGELTPEQMKEYAKERARLDAEEKLDDNAKLARDQEKLDKQKEILKAMERITDMRLKDQGAMEKAIDIRREEIRLEEEALRLSGELEDADRKRFLLEQQGLDARLEGMQKAEAAAKRWLGITEKSGDMFRNVEERTAGWMTQMKSLLNPMNMAGALVEKMYESTLALAVAQDKSIVAFRKATGAIGNYGQVIVDVERSMYNAGVTTDEAGAAMTSLFNNMSDFSMMGQETQKTLTQNVAMLSELGVNAETTSKNMQFMQKVMGANADESARMSRELYTFAQDLGVSADKMASDFQAMGPMIASLGDKGVDAFRALEVQAKNTGMEVDSLLKIAEGFDTFSSAGESVGKLNAILGGPYLNTLEMVSETDPSKRMAILSENVRSAGMSFDDMSYYQKKAMTSALGLNSEMELSMFLSGKLEDMKGPVKTAAEMEELAAQTKEFNTIADEAKQFMMSLAISVSPVVGFIKQMLDGLTKMAPILKVIGIIAAGVAAYMSIMAVASAITTGGLTLAAGVGAAAILGTTAYAMGGSESGKTVGGFAKGGTTPGGPVVVGERGPELVSLPQGSQVAANGSAAFKTGATAASAPAAATAPAAAPTVNVKVVLGDKEMKQLVQEVEVKQYVDGRKSKLYESMMNGVSQEIVKAS